MPVDRRQPRGLPWENPRIADSFTEETRAKRGESWRDEWNMREFLSDALEVGLGGTRA